jgi:hypothetical protein
VADIDEIERREQSNFENAKAKINRDYDAQRTLEVYQDFRTARWAWEVALGLTIATMLCRIGTKIMDRE